MALLENLSEEEAYLFTILSDRSGIDQAELLWKEETDRDTGTFRARPYQYLWWRDPSQFQVDQSSRSVGKSLSISLRAFAHIFVNPGYEMVITAPELIHLEPITTLIEYRLLSTRLSRELLGAARGTFSHRPFACKALNGATIFGRIPQRDGRGLKGVHPLWLEVDECLVGTTLVLTRRGHVPISDVVTGDEVFTHKRRWRKVLGTKVRQRPTVTLRGHGHPGLVCSENHPFYGARTEEGVYLKVGESLDNNTAMMIRPRQWIPAKDMKGQWWSSPTTFPKESWVPSFSAVRTNAKVPCKRDNNDFFWLMGFWLAEGSYSEASHQVTFSVHEDEVPYIQARLARLGLKAYEHRVSDHCINLLVCNTLLGRWYDKNCGKGVYNKEIPLWALGFSQERRQELLDGLIWGDGSYCRDDRYADGRWKLATASKRLAVTARLLGLSLGYSVSIYEIPPPTEPVYIRGRQIFPGVWYQVVGNTVGQGFTFDHLRYSAVREVIPGSVETLYDLTVEEDSSFLADGLIVHNSQDFPDKGYAEVIETLRQGVDGAVWRAHGVTNGVGGWFYDVTKGGSEMPPLRQRVKVTPQDWTIHRLVAMVREDWTDKERQEKIAKYGSRESPDYLRNVLGMHGPAQNVIFILHRLMKCADDDLSSSYNQDEYFKVEIRDSDLQRPGSDVLDFLDFPESLRKYKTIYIGEDVGYVNDPSEILIFAEVQVTPAERKQAQVSKKAIPVEGQSRLKLISRISLHRVPEPVQVEVMLHVIDFFRPVAYALDKTGNGLPLFQNVQQRLQNFADTVKSQSARAALDCIKGYNFSEKILVDFDQSIDVSARSLDEQVRDAGIKRMVLEVSTDNLRSLVDNERLWLPWDRDLLSQFSAQTFSYSRITRDVYGRRRLFSQGDFHTLDAARLAALAHKQHAIDALMAIKEAPAAPVLDAFVLG